jgi:penicillin G amidase
MDIHVKYGFPLPEKYKNDHAISIGSSMYDPDTSSVKGFMITTFESEFDIFKLSSAMIQTPNIDSAWISKNGQFGYTGLGRIPKRKIPEMGSFMKDGSTLQYDMGDYIPDEKLPRLWNPKKGYVAMCNNKFA